MNDQQILSILQQAGFKGQALKTAWAIAKRESSFVPTAHNTDASTRDNSYGLFQVNLFGPLAGRVQQYGLKSAEDLFDPLTNAKVAYKLSKGGKDWGHWGVGKNAYRQTAPLDFSGYPGGGKVQPRTLATTTSGGAAVSGAAPARTMAMPAKMALKEFNQIARQMGFKSFAQAFGIPRKQALELARGAFIVQSPTDPGKLVFKATPPKPATPAARQDAKADTGKGKGVAELFYDPAGSGQQWSPGWTDPIGGHSDHVHVSFSSPQTALRLIQFAQDMGLRVGENPYTDPVDGNHVQGSFHGQMFEGSYGGKQLGRAIDVSGPSEQMMAFYRLARRYIG